VRNATTTMVLTLALTIGLPTWAASPEDKCEASKNQEAGKYAACLLKAEKGLLLGGDAAKHSKAVAKCDAKFLSKWTRAEAKAAKAGTACPATGDEASVMTGIGASTACVSTAISGGDNTCLTCGNGIVNAGEDCDLGTPLASDCSNETGGAAPFGELRCGAGCVFDTADCVSCEPGGVLVGGACWYAGAAGADCDTTCGGLGLAYDEATRTYAGSDGSDANCIEVLDALAFPGDVVENSGPGGDGCAYCASCTPPRLREIFVPTNPFSGDPVLERMCACH